MWSIAVPGHWRVRLARALLSPVTQPEPTPRVCGVCGGAVPRAAARFCPTCGAQMPDASATAPPPASPPTPQWSPPAAEWAPPAAAPTTKSPPTPGEFIVWGSAFVMLIFSFFPFYTVSTFGGSYHWNGWANSFSIFPLVPLMVAIALAMAIMLAVERFGGMQLPERIGPVPILETELIVSGLLVITLLTYVTRDLSPADAGYGAWLLLVGAIGVFVGMILVVRDRATKGAATT